MRRFGRAMDELLRGGRGASEAETRETLRGALRDAHVTFERATPLEEGDFGVLRRRGRCGWEAWVNAAVVGSSPGSGSGSDDSSKSGRRIRGGVRLRRVLVAEVG